MHRLLCGHLQCGGHDLHHLSRRLVQRCPGNRLQRMPDQQRQHFGLGDLLLQRWLLWLRLGRLALLHQLRRQHVQQRRRHSLQGLPDRQHQRRWLVNLQLHRRLRPRWHGRLARVHRSVRCRVACTLCQLPSALKADACAPPCGVQSYAACSAGFYSPSGSSCICTRPGSRSGAFTHPVLTTVFYRGPKPGIRHNAQPACLAPTARRKRPSAARARPTAPAAPTHPRARATPATPRPAPAPPSRAPVRSGVHVRINEKRVDRP